MSLTLESKEKVYKLFNSIKSKTDFQNFDINVFVKWVSKQQEGRPILIRGWDFPPSSTCGIWFTHRSSKGVFMECIFYNKKLPKPLRIRTIFHELAHILCEHTTIISSIEMFTQIIQDRHAFEIYLKNLTQRDSETPWRSKTEEAEAELLAHLIQVELFSLEGEITHSSILQGQSYLEAIGCN